MNNTTENVSSISQMLFDRVISPYKQHATIRVTGDTGTGKSYALIGILEKLSYMLSKYYDEEEPSYYFNIDHVAIITKEEIRRVIKLFKKHGLYLLDDIGVGANARKHQDKDNIALNDIVETFRPNNNVLGTTLPRKRLIDVVQRELVHYCIDMEEPLFEKGYGVGTMVFMREDPVSEIEDSYFPIYNGYQYKKYIFSPPSKDLCKEYDERRDSIYKGLEIDRAENFGKSKKELKFDEEQIEREENNIIKDRSSSIFRKRK